MNVKKRGYGFLLIYFFVVFLAGSLVSDLIHHWIIRNIVRVLMIPFLFVVLFSAIHYLFFWNLTRIRNPDLLEDEETAPETMKAQGMQDQEQSMIDAYRNYNAD